MRKVVQPARRTDCLPPSTSCPWVATRARRVHASVECRVDRGPVHAGKAVKQAGRFRTEAVHREGSRSQPGEFRRRGREDMVGVWLEGLLLAAIDRCGLQAARARRQKAVRRLTGTRSTGRQEDARKS